MSREEINKRHEKTHYSNLEKLEEWISKEYQRLLVAIGSLYAIHTSKALLDIRIEELFDNANRNISSRINDQIEREWQLGNLKNRDYLHNYLRDKSDVPTRYLKDNSFELSEFKRRKFKGKTFIDRLNEYNKLSRIKASEKILSYDKGKSQIYIRRELKDQLKLSEVLRLARAEVHDAFRMSDQVNWKNNPFVTGQEIRVSDIILKLNRCDYCVMHQGVYPKDYNWLKWHINCMCYKLPILMTPMEYLKYKETVSMTA